MFAVYAARTLSVFVKIQSNLIWKP